MGRGSASRILLHRMTETEFRDALLLLDSATALLRRGDRGLGWNPTALRELRRLTLEFDLLRVRLSQIPSELERN
jgi:hypothetical protein